MPLLAAGAGAARLCEVLAACDMHIEVLEGPPGAAATVKMGRSAILKGMEALFLEALLAAEKVGVTAQVLASLNASFPACSLGIWGSICWSGMVDTPRGVLRRCRRQQRPWRVSVLSRWWPGLQRSAAQLARRPLGDEQPARLVGSAVGLTHFIGEFVGGTFAPWLGGVAADHWGLIAPMWIAAAGMFISALLAFGLKETAPLRLGRGAAAAREAVTGAWTAAWRRA